MAAASKKASELFVSRIPWTVARKEIVDYFKQFGQVKKCSYPINRETGFYKGTCWIQFETNEGLTNALQKNTHILDGNTILVQKNRTLFLDAKEKDN